jgi:NAD(P)-dependent dehydrogenase (short-subunit alcohol dehydrogenase family)
MRSGDKSMEAGRRDSENRGGMCVLLKDRVAIITGAASGMGKAAALKFVENGARVLIADVDDEHGREVVAGLEAQGGDALYVHTDVADSAAVQAMAHTALERWGTIDILYNNAAATQLCNTQDRPVHELEEWVWDKMLAISLKSVYLCSKYCLLPMMEKRGGVILNVTSVDAILAEPGFDSYTAAKGGVISLTRSMAAEYGPYDIRVNAISPGYILTEVQMPWFNSNPAAARAAGAAHALNRLGMPDEVAEMAVFLASDKARFITGAIIPVDGGYTAFKQVNADQFAREGE